MCRIVTQAYGPRSVYVTIQDIYMSNIWNLDLIQKILVVNWITEPNPVKKLWLYILRGNDGLVLYFLAKTMN
jgi:hypothetical protein